MKRKSKLNNDFPWAMVFLLPSLLGFALFLFLPIVFSMVLSATNYKGSFENMRFTGFYNFEVLLSDSVFWQSVLVTLSFVGVCVVIQLATGLLFAVLLNNKLRGRTFFRSLFFLPVVLSSVAVCIAFIFIFNPTKGPINIFLQGMGLSPVPWLLDRSTALLTIIIVFVWQSFGYYMVIFLSGLQSINYNLYEAADMDGASGFDKLIHITIPSLSPVIFFSVIIAVINSFKAFDHIYIMTGGQYGGGPADSTRVLAFDIYQKGFLFWQVGYGAAESVLLFLIILFFTFIQNRLQNRWVVYDAG